MAENPLTAPGRALFLLGIILLGIYTALPLPISGSFYIPFVILFITSGFFLLFHWQDLDSLDVLFLFGVSAVLILNILLSAAPLDFMQDKIKAFLQIMAGLLLGIFTARTVAAVPRESLARFLLSVILVVLCLALLERVDIIREWSDRWREFAYTGVFTEAYGNDERDLAMVRFIRPKAFTAEPAFLAGFLFVVLNGLALTCRKRWHAIAATPLAVAGFAIVGSPILLLALISVALIILVRFPVSLPVVLLAGLATAAALLVHPDSNVIGKSYQGLLDRFDSLTEGNLNRIEDESVRSRLVVPFTRTVPASLGLNPVFGIGIGGKEYLSRKMDPNYSSRDTTAGKHEMTMGTNALGSMLSTLGVGGFLLLTGLTVYYLVHRYGYFPLLCLPALILFTFTRGAYETQSFWAVVFLLVGCADKGSPHKRPAPSAETEYRKAQFASI